jgi:hypothetical protein
LSGRLSFDEGVPTPEVGFPKVVGWAGGAAGRLSSKAVTFSLPGKPARHRFRGRSRGAQPG